MNRTLASPVAAAPLGARLFLSVLGRIRRGHLELITPDGARMVFGNAHDAQGATLRLHDWRAGQAI
ncbi:SAM-dependent methyltransferase, partial [Massilia arenosa]